MPAAPTQGTQGNSITVDVEEWYHILDSPAVPPTERWDSLESRVELGLGRLLDMFEETGVRATFFWLGWVAERHKDMVAQCREAGHEIASHGYGHVLAYEVGPKAFRDDISRAKRILEDVIGDKVLGFRAPGFGITDETPWVFEVIREVGYEYDSSVFPATRGHGGMRGSPLGPYIVGTPSGLLVEFPMSTVEALGRRLPLFGGGYLRLAPKGLIRYGLKRLQTAGHPLIIYVHPREVDVEHPRLPLNAFRRFKSYVNMKSTMPKLRWLCQEHTFLTMAELAQEYVAREMDEPQTAAEERRLFDRST
ncbi:MAG: XrtA system polysaccharide deacetylase [Thermodesulfobacteriota bacterium]|nr:XrtA system polysaccharide deacetylase [Thermodesulfobacteriota bacterium]